MGKVAAAHVRRELTALEDSLFVHRVLLGSIRELLARHLVVLVLADRTASRDTLNAHLVLLDNIRDHPASPHVVFVPQGLIAILEHLRAVTAS
jgi:hypothetical protein